MRKCVPLLVVVTGSMPGDNDFSVVFDITHDTYRLFAKVREYSLGFQFWRELKM